jgi:hypothetical protein
MCEQWNLKGEDSKSGILDSQNDIILAMLNMYS